MPKGGGVGWGVGGMGWWGGVGWGGGGAHRRGPCEFVPNHFPVCATKRRNLPFSYRAFCDSRTTQLWKVLWRFVQRFSTYRIPASIRVRDLSWVAIGAVWAGLLLTPHLGEAPEKQTHLPITLAVNNTGHHFLSKVNALRLLRQSR
jgi:hypothetical protein